MQIITGRQQRPLRVLLYGPEGIGKTTFASRFPAPLILDTEGGSGFLDVARVPQPGSWTELMEDVRQVQRDPACCRTLVLDTADWAETLCRRHVCDKGQQTSIEGFGYGKGYVYAAEEYGRLLNALADVQATGRHIVITAHAAMRKFEQPDEMGSYDRWELKLDRRIASMLKEWCDVVLFANFETIVVRDSKTGKAKGQGGQRVMYTAHHACWDAKNRLGLPDKLPLDYAQLAPFIEGAPAPAAQIPAPAPAPEPAPVPAPAPAPEPTVVPETREAGIRIPADAPPELRQALTDLAALCGPRHILPEEIQHAVHQKGYFPESMPLTAYPVDFIRGVLIGAFDQVAALIENDPERLPF